MSNMKSRVASENYFSALKVVATILVVYVHSENLFRIAAFENFSSLRRLFSAINDAAVPAFFLTSGYLLFRKSFDYGRNIKRKIYTLVLPFFIWNTVWFLFELVGSLCMPNVFDSPIYGSIWNSVLNYFGIPFSSKMPFYNPLWFIRDLFILNLFSNVIKRCFEYINPHAMVIALLMVWLSPLNQYARQAICFFCMGGLISYNKVCFSTRGTWFLPVLCGMLGMIIPLFWVNQLLNRIAVLFCFVAVFGILGRSPKVQNKLSKAIPFSFSIYVMHGKILTVLQLVIVRIIPQSNDVVILEYLFIPPIVVGLCVLMSMVLRRITPGFFAIAMGNRYAK